MRVLLELGGWEKVMEVADSAARHGKVTVEFHPPIPVLALAHRPRQDATFTRITFYYTGETRRGLPLFKP